MLTIDIKLNSEIIAHAQLTNLSGQADISTYDLWWGEEGEADLGIPEQSGRALIKGHRRRQTVWVLVARTVEVILGQQVERMEGRG
jgi:hypothetical protein